MYNKDVAKALSSNDSNAKLCDIHLGFLDSLNVLSGKYSLIMVSRVLKFTNVLIYSGF